MTLLFVLQVNDVQAFPNRIPMKCKMQSIFLKYRPFVHILLSFCEAEYCDDREQASKLSGSGLA